MEANNNKQYNKQQSLILFTVGKETFKKFASNILSKKLFPYTFSKGAR